MKPPAFEWYAPDTLDEALALLATHGDAAKPLAGGQSLIPVLNFRLARPAVLIDLNRIASLGGISEANGGVRIGAMTRQRQAERHAAVAERAPLLAETLPSVAHVQIRNRGTVGGSLAHADPAAELPAVMLALDATLRLRSTQGERSVAAADFFSGFFRTALEPGELLVEIDVPARAAASGYAFMEVARRHGDFALLGVAAVVTLDPAGRCLDVRLAFVNAGPGPLRAKRAEDLARGEIAGAELVRATAEAVLADIDPANDVHASADYRRQLARVLTRRALERAVERARPGSVQ